MNTLGKEHSVYRWPGSDIIIDETNPGNLKVSKLLKGLPGVINVLFSLNGEVKKIVNIKI